MTAEDTVAQSMTGVLNSNGHLCAGDVCGHLNDLSRSLDKAPLAAAVVDIDPMPEVILKELESVIRRHSQTKFVVLSSSFDQDLVLLAMHVGVRDFVQKDKAPAKLYDILVKLVANQEGPEDQQEGMVVSVLSAGGGCGATTLAVNLANEQQALSNAKTLLVDLDYSYGAVATYLGLQGRYGVADVLDYEGDLDGAYIQTSVQPYTDNLHALISPASIDYAHSHSLRYDRLASALRACRTEYAWTVVDAPRIGVTAAANLANASNVVAIVLQLSVKDVNAAKSIADGLFRSGVDREKIRFVINRHRAKGSMLTVDEARKALGGSEPILLRNDYRCAVTSINFGQPLAQASPRSKLRTDIQRLASQMTEALELRVGSKAV
jgi:pilus assembly protein CpaE